MMCCVGSNEGRKRAIGQHRLCKRPIVMYGKLQYLFMSYNGCYHEEALIAGLGRTRWTWRRGKTYVDDSDLGSHFD
jgi:hypothetical protein